MINFRPNGLRSWQPGVEPLERRRVPAQFGVPWHDPTHLSISFVPDGTLIASHPSDLFQALDAREPSAQWQAEVLQAFQTWAVNARINVTVKPDGGQPLGTPGPDQEDPRFGDIRIGAQPMSPEVLSISVPHDPFLSGTWSGDILLNSSVAFDGTGVQLFPVLLHEVGHVLGLDHSSDPSSVMFEHLDNTRVELSPGDVAAVQALYGPRPIDPFGEPSSGDSRAAAAIPTPDGFDGATPLLVYGDIATTQTVDAYSLTAPAGYQGPMTIRLQTAGVSLLAPRLTVRDASGHVVADVTSPSNAGDTLEVTLPAVDPSQTYFVEVRGATKDVFGVGTYALAAAFDARSTVDSQGLDTVIRQSYSYLSADDINAIFLNPNGAIFKDDHHTNDTFATATALDSIGAYGSAGPARITASLGDLTDVDVYRIETPDAADGSVDGYDSSLAMTVTVRATQVNGIMPTAAVFDEDRNPVPALVLAHGDGTYTIQVIDARPGTDYFVRVSSDSTAGKAVGNYDLDVDYGHVAASPTTFAAAALDTQGGQATYGLVVHRTQLFDFLLNAQASAGTGAGATDAAVRMSIVDGEGRNVASRISSDGETTGGDPLLLVPGTYQVRFTAATPAGGAPVPIAFRLYGASLTDPIGPALDDPTLRPVASPTSVDSAPAIPPSIGSTSEAYTWLALSLDVPRGQDEAPSALGLADHQVVPFSIVVQIPTRSNDARVAESPGGRDLSAVGGVAVGSGRPPAIALAGLAVRDSRLWLHDAALAGFGNGGDGGPSTDPRNIAIAGPSVMVGPRESRDRIDRAADESRSPGKPADGADLSAPGLSLQEPPVLSGSPAPPIRGGEPSDVGPGPDDSTRNRNQLATIGRVSAPVAVLLGLAVFLVGRRRQREECAEGSPLPIHRAVTHLGTTSRRNHQSYDRID